MIKSIPLELLNGWLFILFTCATFIFVHYVWVKKDLKYFALRPAIALLAVWIGEVILRSSVWYIRNQINDGYPVIVPNNVYMISAAFIGIGILCVIRVFSPQEWGNKSWIISLLLATLFVVWSYIY